MSSLTALFGNSQDDSEDSDKLKELYWNRAELKKEFAQLREENFKLGEEIKRRDGRAARHEQKLEHLESLLLDPEWVYNVVVYYQLRALNERCKAKVSRFAEQLKQQREKRKHGQLLADWNDKRQGEAGLIEERVGGIRMQLQILEDQMQAEEHRLANMNGFVRLFRKSAVKRAIAGYETDRLNAQATESELLGRLEEIHLRSAPDTEGLDIASKRSINFMILSFVQQLYLHFSDDNLAGLVHEAGTKSVGAINYGNKNDCDLILAAVDKHSESMEKASGFADVLQHRAKLLAEKALYKADDDAVAVPGTVATVYSIDPNGVVRERDANLLGENYWDVAKIVSR